MPEVNGQYAMNPQVAQAKGDQAGDGRTDGESAGYVELPGAKKDADCTSVNVQGGISSAGGRCEQFQAAPDAQGFSCGSCTMIQKGQQQPGAAAAVAAPAEPTSTAAMPQSS
jgi:hypothetical protein